MSVSSLLVNVALTSFALTMFVVCKCLIRFISARLSLRHIPGPTPTSLIWGEEWNLYHNAPGSHYLEWHQQFGKVVKFRGAFGVLFFRTMSTFMLNYHSIRYSL
jgi:hypothetical protein